MENKLAFSYGFQQNWVVCEAHTSKNFTCMFYNTILTKHSY